MSNILSEINSSEIHYWSFDEQMSEGSKEQANNVDKECDKDQEPHGRLYNIPTKTRW